MSYQVNQWGHPGIPVRPAASGGGGWRRL